MIEIFSRSGQSTDDFVAKTVRNIGDDQSEIVGGIWISGKARIIQGQTEQYLTFTDMSNGKEVVGYFVYDPNRPLEQHHLLKLPDKTIVISSSER
jgi:hypothetical protein